MWIQAWEGNEKQERRHKTNENHLKQNQRYKGQLHPEHLLETNRKRGPQRLTRDAPCPVQADKGVS